MTVHIAHAGIEDTDTIATMVGELLKEIMAGRAGQGLWV